MNTRFAVLGIAPLLWASSCAAHSVSGAYINQGRNFVELLQITAKKDGSVEGTLTHSELKSDGGLAQNNSSLKGSIDGQSITVIFGTFAQFLGASSLSGTFKGGVISLTLPDGVARYTTSNPAAYQLAVQHMKDQGDAIKRQNYIDRQNAAVADLTNRLSDYTKLVLAPRNAQLLQDFHTAHAGAIAKARNGLDVQQRYPTSSVAANQTFVNINQLVVSIQAQDVKWEGIVAQGRARLQELDSAITGSPCADTQARLSNCAAQLAAAQAYQAAKSTVEGQLADIESTVQSDRTTMETILKRAGDYAQ